MKEVPPKESVRPMTVELTENEVRSPTDTWTDRSGLQKTGPKNRGCLRETFPEGGGRKAGLERASHLGGLMGHDSSKLAAKDASMPLKDRIVLAHELQHPHSSLPCWIGVWASDVFLKAAGGNAAKVFPTALQHEHSRPSGCRSLGKVRRLHLFAWLEAPVGDTIEYYGMVQCFFENVVDPPWKLWWWSKEAKLNQHFQECVVIGIDARIAGSHAGWQQGLGRTTR